MAANDDFLGKGWGFPPQFNKATGGVEMVSDEEDIRQSLKILLNTTPGERTMLPQYGCNMREFLFQDIDTSLQNYMKNVVSNAILQYESRIQLNDLVVHTNEAEDGVVTLDITYTVRATNNRNNVVYPFYLNEGTLVDK